MKEKIINDPKARKRLGEALKKGTLNLADSKEPENTVLAGLRMIGCIEEREGNHGLDIGFMIIKTFTTLLARSRMWTPEQIQEAINEGRRIERMTSGKGESSK